MKIKFVFIFLGLVIIIITLGFFAQHGRETVSLQHKTTVENDQGQLASEPEASGSQLLSPLASKNRAITIIKPKSTRTETEASVTLLGKNEDKEGARNSLSSVENTATGSVLERENVSSESKAGVTKIGKKPSPKEIKEMNSQGVVIY